jgi:hypothetical protein
MFLTCWVRATMHLHVAGTHPYFVGNGMLVILKVYVEI